MTTKQFEVSWRGEAYRFRVDDHLVLHGAGPTGSGVCLWEPRHDEIFQRDHWIADVFIRGFGFLEAHGATPQDALDALAAELPASPMVRGGTC